MRQGQLFKILGLDKDGYLANLPTSRNIMLNARAKTFVEVIFLCT